MSGGGNAGSSSSTGGGQFSWDGGKPATSLDPKQFGTQLLGDAQTAYGQGPQINPISPYTPLSGNTTSLINGATGSATANNAALSPFASGANINANPYMAAMLANTNNQTSQDVNQTFASNGRFGSDIHAQALATGLANTDNSAQFGQYNTDVGQMLQAQGQQGNNTAQALQASGQLDQNAAQQTAANSTMWDRTNLAPFNQISQYLSLMQNPSTTSNTNQPTSLWNILGAGASVLGSLL